jgi:hypothetical protein
VQETPLEQLRKEARELALRAKSQMEAEWDRLVSGPPNYVDYYDGIDMETRTRQRLCDLEERLARLEECKEGARGIRCAAQIARSLYTTLDGTCT